jgi:hypothetical protein
MPASTRNAADIMSSWGEGVFMSNPWMSLWLSAANAWAGAVRSFWTAEIRRQQTAMLNEMTRQMVRFWSGARALPSSRMASGGAAECLRRVRMRVMAFGRPR